MFWNIRGDSGADNQSNGDLCEQSIQEIPMWTIHKNGVLFFGWPIRCSAVTPLDSRVWEQNTSNHMP